MRILGVDPGTQRCGYGVIEVTGQALTYVECGVIVTPAGAELSLRLADVGASVAEVLDELRPDVVAVEDVFHGIDARAALVLGHARGVVLAAAGARRLPVHAYAPATVKRTVAGSGAAAKAQVNRVVQLLLSLGKEPRHDASDALAVAICHARHAAAAARIAKARPAVVPAKAARPTVANRAAAARPKTSGVAGAIGAARGVGSFGRRA